MKPRFTPAEQAKFFEELEPEEQEAILAKPIGLMIEAELIFALKRPHWRMRNIYWVSDKEGKAVLFQPWPEQQRFLDNIWYRNVIPKARQRGFSTVVQIMMLDACIFVPNTSAVVIAQDDTTALQIFAKKVKFAWDRLPPIVHQMAPLKYDNKHELVWLHGSSILVATSTRGNTLQYLHVSEYGQICAKNPHHANEIQEGSLPSVDTYGVIVIESTVESPFGTFSDMVRAADKIKQLGTPLTPMDYMLHFASWWDAPEYELDPEHVIITPEDNAYFFRVEAAIGRDISVRKRAWYVKKRDSDFGGSNEKMWRQYPSTLDEAFTVSSEGLWLSEQMARVRRERRICKLPILQDRPVNTFWDLRDNKVVWLHQKDGPWDNFISCIEMSGEPYITVVRELNKFMTEHTFVWGKHYLPHDGNTKHEGAEQMKTPHDMLYDLGLRNIEIVPRIHDLTVGIDQLRQDMVNHRYDEERCAGGVRHLDGYSKVWNERMGIWSETVLDNEHTHATDALRQKAQVAHLLRSANSNGRGAPKRRRSGMSS
ncbi:hypothetical protein [Aminobacter sp. MDW-2]|uniref:hypothetical protein n=1 Tax=Aminobacter sp. MDW-2 TaxID=2666139 RepID=UPI0012AF2B60|nr:hypothetical protein [Aminobacter sp. MDW-2]MRX32819.1 hypothetical protein [Aminobacter sp. MDW-2]QNH34522.1 hypothetical protein H5P29_00780 [Aminobacter sp. MDW-2]